MARRSQPMPHASQLIESAQKRLISRCLHLGGIDRPGISNIPRIFMTAPCVLCRSARRAPGQRKSASRDEPSEAVKASQGRERTTCFDSVWLVDSAEAKADNDFLCISEYWSFSAHTAKWYHARSYNRLIARGVISYRCHRAQVALQEQLLKQAARDAANRILAARRASPRHPSAEIQPPTVFPCSSPTITAVLLSITRVSL